MNEVIVKEAGLPSQNVIANNLLTQAIEKGGSVEMIEKLLTLQERWERNQARKTFLEAMNLFQSIVPALEKKKQVKYNTSKGVTNYKYAPLGEIVEVIKPSLKETGLSYRWEIKENGNLSCSCIISHVDGHSETTTMSATKDSSGGKNDIQSRGSTITYLQRYTLTTALGIATADEDNDGRSTAQDKDKPKPQNLSEKYDEMFKGKSPEEIKKIYKTLEYSGEEKQVAIKIASFWGEEFKKNEVKSKSDPLVIKLINDIVNIEEDKRDDYLTELDKVVDEIKDAAEKRKSLDYYKVTLSKLNLEHEIAVVPF